VRGDDRDLIPREAVDVAAGYRRAVGDVRDDPPLDHSLDDRPARVGQPERQVHAGVELADRPASLRRGDRLRVAAQVIREQVRERE
jgi:hypothetical protein